MLTFFWPKFTWGRILRSVPCQTVSHPRRTASNHLTPEGLRRRPRFFPLNVYSVPQNIYASRTLCICRIMAYGCHNGLVYTPSSNTVQIHVCLTVLIMAECIVCIETFSWFQDTNMLPLEKVEKVESHERRYWPKKTGSSSRSNFCIPRGYFTLSKFLFCKPK